MRGARQRGGGATGCLPGRDPRPGSTSPRRPPSAPPPRAPFPGPGAAVRGLPAALPPQPRPRRSPPPRPPGPSPPPPSPAPAGPPRVPGEERRAGGARGWRGPGAPPLGPRGGGWGRLLPGAAPHPRPASRDARRAGRTGRGDPRRPLPGPTGGGGSGGRAPEAVPGGWASWEWHGRVPGEARGPAGPPPGERAPTCRPLRRPGDAPPSPTRTGPRKCPGAVGELIVGAMSDPHPPL